MTASTIALWFLRKVQARTVTYALFCSIAGALPSVSHAGDWTETQRSMFRDGNCLMMKLMSRPECQSRADSICNCLQRFYESKLTSAQYSDILNKRASAELRYYVGSLTNECGADELLFDRACSIR